MFSLRLRWMLVLLSLFGGPTLLYAEAPLALSLFELDSAADRASKEEYEARIHSRIARIDSVEGANPSGPPLLLLPGMGRTFRDLHALVRLRDQFDLMVGYTESRLPLRDTARALAGELRSKVRARGASPSEWIVLGHSLGAALSHLVAAELLAGGALHGPSPEISGLRVLALDGPFRGVDGPWFLTVPGVRRLTRWALTKLPLPRRITSGELSFLNRSPSMEALAEVEPTPLVTFETAWVLGTEGGPNLGKRGSPVGGPRELSRDEHERLFDYYRHGARDPRRLRPFRWGRLGRDQALANLHRALERDTSFSREIPGLIESAQQLEGARAFSKLWGEALDRVFPRFQGHHTEFMWEDPSFMPWLRGRLSGSSAAARKDVP